VGVRNAGNAQQQVAMQTRAGDARVFMLCNSADSEAYHRRGSHRRGCNLLEIEHWSRERVAPQFARLPSIFECQVRSGAVEGMPVDAFVMRSLPATRRAKPVGRLPSGWRAPWRRSRCCQSQRAYGDGEIQLLFAYMGRCPDEAPPLCGFRDAALFLRRFVPPFKVLEEYCSAVAGEKARQLM